MPLLVLSFDDEINFATRDADTGCTKREVRFGRFCLKLPSILKTKETKILSKEDLNQLFFVSNS